jgi:hypothetical protein
MAQPGGGVAVVPRPLTQALATSGRPGGLTSSQAEYAGSIPVIGLHSDPANTVQVRFARRRGTPSLPRLAGVRDGEDT